LRQDDFIRSILKTLSPEGEMLGRDEFFNSSVLIPFWKKNDEYHLLFQVRNENIRQGGEVCFPGGGFEKTKDKNYLDTAIRETTEELGIKKEKIHILGNFGKTVSSLGAVIESFAGIIDIEDPLLLPFDKSEVKELFTVPFSFFQTTEPEIYHARITIQPSYTDENGEETISFPAKKLGLPALYHQSWGNKNYPILLYRWEDKIIWGLTARLIHFLVKKLNSL